MPFFTVASLLIEVSARVKEVVDARARASDAREVQTGRWRRRREAQILRRNVGAMGLNRDEPSIWDESVPAERRCLTPRFDTLNTYRVLNRDRVHV
jgi:hypothetical protein